MCKCANGAATQQKPTKIKQQENQQSVTSHKKTTNTQKRAVSRVSSQRHRREQHRQRGRLAQKNVQQTVLKIVPLCVTLLLAGARLTRSLITQKTTLQTTQKTTSPDKPTARNPTMTPAAKNKSQTI